MDSTRGQTRALLASPTGTPLRPQALNRLAAAPGEGPAPRALSRTGLFCRRNPDVRVSLGRVLVRDR